MKRLHGMELFAEVAKAHSFSRAAAALGVPTSTVSRHVAELERSVGLRLLNRNTRRVELTDAGRLYFERCRRIVAEAELAHAELREHLDTPSGPLRVQLPAAHALDALMPAMVAFGRRYPDIRLQLSVAERESAERAPDAADVSIRLGELPDSTLVARRLGAVQAGLYASPAYLTARGAPREPEDLERHDCIGLRQGACPAGPWRLRRGTERRDVPASLRYGANDACMARQLSQMGAGIAALGGGADGLVRVLPTWSLEPVAVHAVTETRLLPAKTRRLIDFLAEYLDAPAAALAAEPPLARAA